MAAVGECVETGDCDCERIGQKVALVVEALAILALVVVSRGRANKLAAEETAALIERLRAGSSTVPVGTIKTLEEVRALLVIGGDSDSKMEQALNELLDSMRGLQQDAFAGAQSVGVTIKP